MADNDTDAPTNRSYTPVRGVAVLDAEVQRGEHRLDAIEKRLRMVEDWKSALAGVSGQPGALAQLTQEIEEMQETHAGALKDYGTKVELNFGKHDERISAVEHVTLKILVTAGAASLVGGGMVALALHFLGH